MSLRIESKQTESPTKKREFIPDRLQLNILQSLVDGSEVKELLGRFGGSKFDASVHEMAFQLGSRGFPETLYQAIVLSVHDGLIEVDLPKKVDGHLSTSENKVMASMGNGFVETTDHGAEQILAVRQHQFNIRHKLGLKNNFQLYAIAAVNLKEDAEFNDGDKKRNKEPLPRFTQSETAVIQKMVDGVASSLEIARSLSTSKQVVDYLIVRIRSKSKDKILDDTKDPLLAATIELVKSGKVTVGNSNPERSNLRLTKMEILILGYLALGYREEVIAEKLNLQKG